LTFSKTKYGTEYHKRGENPFKKRKEGKTHFSSFNSIKVQKLWIIFHSSHDLTLEPRCPAFVEPKMIPNREREREEKRKMKCDR
jgi:hypothetical protein